MDDGPNPLHPLAIPRSSPLLYHPHHPQIAHHTPPRPNPACTCSGRTPKLYPTWTPPPRMLPGQFLATPTPTTQQPQYHPPPSSTTSSPAPPYHPAADPPAETTERYCWAVPPPSDTPGSTARKYYPAEPPSTTAGRQAIRPSSTARKYYPAILLPRRAAIRSCSTARKWYPAALAVVQ